MPDRFEVIREGKTVEVDRTIDAYLGEQVLDKDWSIRKLLYSEAEAIESAYGDKPLSEWWEDMLNGSRRAERLFIWTYLKRSDPGLRLADVNPEIGDFRFEITWDDVEPVNLDPTQAADAAPETQPDSPRSD